MAKLFTKKQFFAFLVSFFITLTAGFFVWGLFLGSNNYVYVFNKVLGQASLPVSNDVNIIFEEEPEKNNIIENSFEEEILEQETPLIITREMTELERQDLLDDIAEKLDIIQQKVNELVAQLNPDNEQNEEDIDKQDTLVEDKIESDEIKSGDAINYPTILISEVQITIENRFIKLYNPTDQNVSLIGWYLQKKTETSDTWSSCVSSALFNGKIILAQSYFLISKNNLLADIFDENLTVTENNLLVLKNPNREISSEFLTVAPPVVADNTSPSNSAPVVYPKILISEIKISPISQRFIEFYNPNETDTNLTGWYLQKKTITGSDYSSFISKSYFINKTIFAKGYFLISRSDFEADIFKNDLTITKDNSFVLKNPKQEVSDELVLIGQNPDEDRSLCKIDFSDTNWEICLPTPGAQNQKYVETPANDSGDYFLGSEDYFQN
jgi:hypothetical protein